MSIEKLEKEVSECIKRGNSWENPIFELASTLYDEILYHIENSSNINGDAICDYLTAFYSPFEYIKFENNQQRKLAVELYRHLNEKFSIAELDYIHSYMPKSLMIKVYKKTISLFANNQRLQEAICEEMQDFDVISELLSGRCQNSYWGANIGYSSKLSCILMCPDLTKKIVDYDPYQLYHLYYGIGINKDYPIIKDEEEVAIAALASSKKYLENPDYRPSKSNCAPLRLLKSFQIYMKK